VVPVLVRDTDKARKMVEFLFGKGILVVGLTFPVVPRGDETLRFQLNAAHTEKDVDLALKALEEFRDLKHGSGK
jgi:glycine C-acetyltransferase